MEVIGLIISGLAFLLAVYSTMRVRKYEKNQNKLIEMQLEEKKVQQIEKNRAKCDVNIHKLNNSDYVLKIFNSGKSDAKDINFEILEGENFNFVLESRGTMFPISLLEKQKGTDFQFCTNLSSSLESRKYKISWENSDGTKDEKVGMLSIPVY